MRGVNKITGTVVAGAVALTACGGSTQSVDGARDDLRHVTEKSKQATRTVPDYKRECATKTRTKTVNGKTKTETYQDCNRVRVGQHTETYRKVTRKERWCVELDNVNGKRSDDDQWFTVTSGEYHRAAKLDEGDKVNDLKFIRRGC